MIVVVDELLQTLKNKIIICFDGILVRMEKGHRFEKYEDVKEAMIAVDYIENYEIDDLEKENILNRYILLLS